MEYTDEDLIKTLVHCRDKVAEMERACDEATEKLKANIIKLSSALEARMMISGHKSVKTSEGTASLTVRQNAICSDWIAFDDYVVKTGQPELFQRKINSTLIKEILEQTGKLPPGVMIQAVQSVSVRRPAGTASA